MQAKSGVSRVAYPEHNCLYGTDLSEITVMSTDIHTFLLHMLGGRDVQPGWAVHVWGKHAGGARHGARQQQLGGVLARQ